MAKNTSYCENSQLVRKNYSGQGFGQPGRYKSRPTQTAIARPDGSVVLFSVEATLDPTDGFVPALHPNCPAAPLGLSKVTNLQDRSKPRPRRKARGLNGLTGAARRAVIGACKILEQRHGTKRLSFLTCTLPGNLPHVPFICQAWAEIVRRFRQALREKLMREGLDDAFVGVTEIQTLRQKKYGGIPLHLHLVFHGRISNKPGTWRVSKEWSDKAWETAVCGVLPMAKELSFQQACNIQMVKKSAGQYLSKYFSKGAVDANTTSATESVRVSHASVPSTWYLLTSSMRKSLVTATQKGPQLRERIETALRSGVPIIAGDLRPWPIDFPRGGRKWFYIGSLSPTGERHLKLYDKVKTWMPSSMAVERSVP